MKNTLRHHVRLLTALLALPMLTAQAQETPTMGWSSWNTFAINISEDIIRGQADAMVSTGLSKAGYRYVNIDDGYFGGRNAETGELRIHPSRFPNGLQPLVDYIHRLGLKAGIYSDAGRHTCGNFWGGDTIAHDVGLYGYEAQDCRFFFHDIGFDFIKVDFCGGTDWTNVDKTVLDEQQRYTAISNAIRATGRRDVRLNVCRWDYPGTWVSGVATSWRMSHDIADEWPSVADIIHQNLYMSAYSSPGHYNDMDMLEVGRSLSDEEDKTHFGLWCMMNSPLLIGCDLRSLKPQTLSLITNPALIAINQDAAMQQAYVTDRQQGCYILVRDLKKRNGKQRAFAVYNPADTVAEVRVKLRQLDMEGVTQLRDCFTHDDIAITGDVVNVCLPPHATRIYTAKARRRHERTCYEAECGFISDYQEVSNPLSAGTAYYDEADDCHGGACVRGLGGRPENDLLWREVYSRKGGSYTLTIATCADEPRTCYIELNGKILGSFTSSKGKQQLKVRLKKGTNTLRLFNNTAPMPDIDYAEIGN